MLSVRKVAVTGGLASGKSTVCRLFRECGAHTVSADEIVHQLLTPSTDLGKQVVALLGSEIVSGNRIDRQKIAEKVFTNPALLRALESLTHPAVKEEINRQYELVKQKAPLFVAEVPLLFEVGADAGFDATIAVASDESHCLERAAKAGLGIQQFKQRMARQLPMAEKQQRADYVLTNNSDLEQLKKAVEKLFHQLTTLS